MQCFKLLGRIIFQYSHSRLALLGAVFFGLLTVTPVYAATITFTGTIGVIEVDNGSSKYSGLTVGDSFSGRITYGNSAADASFVETDPPISATYFFNGTPYGGFITDGSIISAGANSEVGIGDNDGMGDDAVFINNLYGAGSTTAGAIADTWFVDSFGSSPGFGTTLYSLDTSLYAGTGYQVFPPSLVDSDFAVFYIGEADEFDNEVFLATGILTSLTVGPDPVPACGTTLTTNTTLTADMVCPDRAIFFNAGSANVVLDCAGHSISTTSDRVISANFASGITIKNCTISTGHRSGRGIVMTEVTNSEISNNTISTTGDSSRAITLRGNSNSNLISDNTVHTAGLFSNSIRIEASANFNTVTNNTFQADASYAVSIRSASGNELTGNTLISPEGYLYQGKHLLQNGGLSVDSAGNIYAVENNWGSSAGGNSGIGEGTAFFLVDPITGLANSVIPLLSGGVDVGFGFDALDILADGRVMALTGFVSGGASPLYEINPISGEVTAIALNLPGLPGKLNGLEATSNNTLLATTNAGGLASINLTTGDVTEIGRQGIGWTGLAIHPTSGKAYTVSRQRNEASNSAHLYEINVNTGQVIAHIGDTGIAAISGIDFAPDGTLYGNFDLFVIDITTGQGTFVGSFGDDPLEPISQSNTIHNNVMLTEDGSIQSTNSIILPSGEIDISSTLVKISANEAMVDSAILPFLDDPARITLEDLAGTERSLLIDPEDDGTFVACDSQCTPVSFTDGTLIFDVDGFTTYSSVEGANAAADIVIDFGASIGLYARMNDTNWLRLNPASPTQVVTGDVDGNGEDDVIAAFDFGIFIKYNLGPWQLLHKTTPQAMSVGDLDNNGQDDVVIDFGGIGLYARMNNTSWLRLNPASPTQVVTGDVDGNGADDVIAAFDFGTFIKYNLGAWQRLHKTTAQALSIGDLDDSGQDDVVIDFGAGVGLYARMNDTNWLKLYNGSPDLITTGDIDGNGADDVVATFGSSVGGSWVKLNLGSWSRLNPAAADDIVTGDVDASGQDDVIASFGSTIGGIYVKRNQGAWTRLHNSSSEALATGHLDGN